ncbi:TonB-dependent receptor [Hyphococcus sp.]|uniref:TonB-dependent receptor n=1 Tax=Hyphococcus sp. TaxID=2038636 RepID=UPI003CCC3F5D
MTLSKTLSAGVAAIAITTAFAAVTAPTPAFAQSTTGAIRGSVVGPNGQPVSGAQVTITDQTTGASTSATTGPSGAFSARGLSVSGLYSVRVVTDQYADQTVADIRLTLGDTTNVPFQLSGTTASDEIVVVASRGTVAEVATGPSAIFSAADLADLPVVNRDIKDVIRLDPRITIDESFERGIRCVGSNERFNSLTVDGVRQNDDFGLNNNGYPTQRLPFPFDVSEQVAVEIAPVDVEYGGFTGCNVNVVTKSGGNEFHGRLFVDYNFAGLHGDSLEGDPVNKPESDEKSYGAVITGPIIKDRLFFTAAYEKFKGSDSFNTGPEGSGRANEVNGVTQADVDTVTQILNDVYGFDPLGLPNSASVQDERFYVKLNGYITDNHRFELAYQDTFGDNVVPQNTSASAGDLGLASNWYRRSEDLEAYSGRLFSEWTDNFSTEVRISYQDRVTGQNSLNGTDFAQFEIATPGGGAIFVGPDSFRHANALAASVWNVKFKGEYAYGDHLFKLGYERDIYEAFNLFVPFSEGQAEFDSIADLQAMMPSAIFYQNAGTNVKADGAATFKRSLNTAYVQDDWSLQSNVTLTAGLRFDWISMKTAPAFNQIVLDRFGVPNDTTFDGLSLLQPRVGLDWDVTDRFNVSAGVGRFSGGDPSVWLSNSFSNTGFLPGSSFSADPMVINGFDGFTLPQAMQDEVAASSALGTGATALVDPDYKMSSIWRFTLGAKYVADFSAIGLGDEWGFGADVLYNIEQDPNIWKNLDLGVIGTAPDGRPIYNTQFGYGNAGVLMLTNSDQKPKTFVVSGYFDKEINLDRFSAKFYGGYAYTDSEDVNPATSSTQQSNFENIAAIDYNNPIVARSNYGVTHAFTARVDLGYEFIRDLQTRLSLTGQLNSGKPFSYTFDTSGSSSGDAVATDTNLFGDSDRSEDRSLLYIPSGPGAGDDPLVIYGAGFDLAGFNQFLAATGLDAYRGQIAPRNGFESDWWGKIDLRFEQELPGLRDGDRLRFIIDVDNFTNLLNDDWGVYRELTFGNSGHNAEIIAAEIVAGQYQFNSFDPDPAEQSRIFEASVWEINFGLRYDF